MKVGYDREPRFFRRDLNAIIEKGPVGDLFTFALASPTLVVVRKAPK